MSDPRSSTEEVTLERLLAHIDKPDRRPVAELVARLNEITGADDAYGDASFLLRNIQIEFNEIGDVKAWFDQWYADAVGWAPEVAFETVQELFDLYTQIVETPIDGREAMTELALADSLCPFHFIDYAICFDDQTPECQSIRVIHPGHDT